jgi:PAS domain S-box-containing protein
LTSAKFEEQRRRAAAELVEAQAKLEVELTDTKLLQNISAELVQQENVTALYETIVDGAVAIMRSDFASMQQLHPQRGNGELRLLAFRGFNPQAAKFWEWVRTDSESSCSAALRTGRRVIVPDVEQCDFMAGTEDLVTYLQTGIHAVQSTPLLSRSGKLLGIISTHWRKPHEPSERDLRQMDILARQAADIIESKQATDALRRAKEYDEAVMNNMGEGLYTVDNQGLVTFMNPAAERLFGWTLDELRGQKMHDVTHYKHADGSPFPAEECAGLQVLRQGKVLTDQEDVFIRKDGRFFDVVYSSSPIRENGVITGLAVVFRDVTDRKQAEETKAKLAAIVESTADAIISKDLTGIIMSWNQGAERLFGYTEREAIGQPITILIPPDHLKEEPHILERIRRGERVEHYETVRRRKDGTLVDISLTVSPITNAQGKIVGASKIARDITARKVVELALHENQTRLKAALEAAQAAARAKDQFLAAVSHELRTPLTPVLMSAMMLQEDKTLPLSVRNVMEMIGRNIQIETRMVNDLLDLSRSANDKFELYMTGCNLHQIIRRALEVCMGGGNPKKLKIVTQLRARRPHAYGDATRLQQVFWNLIQNAMKFTPDGGRITISSRNVGERVCVAVADTGRGIDSPLLEKIFEPFEQGNDNGKESLRGLGLGLTIARRIVAAHSGTLAAASKGRNRGAVFTVALRTVQNKPTRDPLRESRES